MSPGATSSDSWAQTGPGRRRRCGSSPPSSPPRVAARRSTDTPSPRGGGTPPRRAQPLPPPPPILLLDEPAGGLDPQGIRFFRDLVRKLQGEGKTVFLSSHILSEVEQTCTTVGIIHRGRMVVVERMDALRQRNGEGAGARVEGEGDRPSPPGMPGVLG